LNPVLELINLIWTWGISPNLLLAYFLQPVFILVVANTFLSFYWAGRVELLVLEVVERPWYYYHNDIPLNLSPVLLILNLKLFMLLIDLSGLTFWIDGEQSSSLSEFVTFCPWS
jgi:hypothetical protein